LLVWTYFCRMENLWQQIDALRSEISSITTTRPEEIEAFRIKYLGTKGAVKQLMNAMKEVPADKKKEAGQLLNDFKLFVSERYEQLLAAAAPDQKAASIDTSLPGQPFSLGSRHPVTLMKNRIVSTFYIQQNPGWVLRTHTSSVQIREMEKGKLPIRMLMPGRVFRNETVSARSHCFFHQVEGLYIDEQVSFADLKQTLYFFVKEMYGADVNVRFRPSYFPFTEPSAEMDVSCFICKGEGCPVCKKSGWVEILGCGMVHPNVLSNCGIDPEKYSGFAFGMGVERPAMLKYGVSDLRLFSENDIRFLQQFAAAT